MAQLPASAQGTSAGRGDLTHNTRSAARTRSTRRTGRTGIAMALAGLVTFSLAAPASAYAQLPDVNDLFGGNGVASSNSSSVELPIYGRLPNPDFEGLLGGSDDGGDGADKPAKELTPEQQAVADKSILNSLPLAPTRSASAGTLVEAEDVSLMVNDKLWNADAKQIKYNSTDSLGNASVDTGIVITPNTEWKGPGPRPVVAIAPGTQGAGEHCDPSETIQTGLVVKVGPLDLMAAYEAIPTIAHLKRGATVVMIDHHRNAQGNQDYVDNIASAQSLLDAVTASQELGVDSEAPVGIYGYSQGGSAAAAAAERAGVYAPELNVKATSAGGPPSDLANVLDQIDGSVLTPLIALAINSVLDKDQDLRRVLEVEMSEEGKRLLGTASDYCVGGLAFHHAFESTKQYTADGESLSEIIKRYDPVLKELDRQRVGNFVPNAPVFLYSGQNDDIIPINQVHKLRDAWLDLGFTDLEYHEDTTPELIPKSGLNHVVPMLSTLQQATDYIWAHFPAQPEEQSLEL